VVCRRRSLLQLAADRSAEPISVSEVSLDLCRARDPDVSDDGRAEQQYRGLCHIHQNNEREEGSQNPKWQNQRNC